MKIKLLKSKIHRAKVTDANLEYEGSIAVDSKLMSASGLKKHEKVHVLNLTNGSRLQTYVIPDEPGSKSICINGAAAHLVDPGDRVRQNGQVEKNGSIIGLKIDEKYVAGFGA